MGIEKKINGEEKARALVCLYTYPVTMDTTGTQAGPSKPAACFSLLSFVQLSYVAPLSFLLHMNIQNVLQ
jgi:hypothetical protein